VASISVPSKPRAKSPEQNLKNLLAASTLVAVIKSLLAVLSVPTRDLTNKFFLVAEVVKHYQ
jgi:hypothetical protein